MGAVIAVPEIWAAAADPPWPDLGNGRAPRGALGRRRGDRRLRDRARRGPHGPYSWRETGAIVEQADGQARSHGVRPLLAQADRDRRRPAYVYFSVALVCVVAGSAAADPEHGRVGPRHVIHGLIGFFGVIVPSVLAYWSAKDVPFPTLTRTIANLGTPLHFVAMLVLAGLVVLLIHLAFYPWPDVFRQSPTPASR